MTNVPQNTDFKIFVTHVDSDGPLLRIFGQTDQESSLHVEKLMEQLTVQFSKGLGRPSPQSHLSNDLICCAMFEQGYYRAKIHSMHRPGAYVVQFIDYGNTEILDINNIRLLEDIPQAAQLLQVPQQAFEFIVSGILPRNGNWEAQTIDTILSNLRYSEYPARIVNSIDKYHLIDMLFSGQNFANFLVNQNMAIRATIEEMFRMHTYVQQQQMHPSKTLMQVHEHQDATREGTMQMRNTYSTMKQIPTHPAQPTQQYRGNSGQENWRAHPAPGLFTPSLRQPNSQPQPETQIQDATVFTFKSRSIVIDTQHEVTVSYVENGPHLFCIQLKSTANELEALMRNINAHTPRPLVKPPLIGSVCLGRYSVEKKLLRAVVMKVTEHCCKLHYVDYGYGEVLPHVEIYQIPPQYTIPAAMAMRFALNRVNELNVTEEMKQYFKNLVNGKTLLLHVRPNVSSSPLIHYGDLYDNGRNVKDILSAAFPNEVPPWQGCCKLAEGAQEVVFVIHVESCNKFYVQLDREVRMREALMTLITEYVKTAPPFKPTEIRPHLHCIAFSNTYRIWARAEIVRVTEDKVTVFFVDFGNEETIPVTTIRSIRDPEVTKLRAQAIRCILNGYERECSTVELDKSLTAAILDEHLAMRVKNVIPAGPIVELFDPSVTPMVNILQKLKQGFTNGNMPTKNSNDKSKNATNISTRSDDQGNKWNNHSRIDPPRVQDPNPLATNPNSKNWKEEENDQGRFDNRYHNRGNDRERSMGAAFPQNDTFPRDEGKNDRFSRDKPRQERYDRNERYERPDDSNANIRGSDIVGRAERGFGSGRFSGNNSRQERNGNGEKSSSDKDSDTSSRGSGRHGRRDNGGRGGGGRGRREGGPGRNSNSQDIDDESDRNVKSRSNKFSRIRDVRRDFADRSETKQFDSWANKSTQSSTIVKIPPPNITVGAIKNCDLVFINSPTDFYVQLSPDNLELDAIMANIAATYENGGKILQRSMIKPGTDCVAQYSEDNQWYRATVQSVEATGTNVYFVDYGNSETVEFGKIKELDANSAKLASQAIACKLLGASKSTWDINEVVKFRELTEGKSLEAEFVAQENKVYEILLREVVDTVPATKYINEEFSAGADLTLAKNVARNKGRQGSERNQVIEPTDYAPLDQKWSVETINPGSKQNVIVTWFTNPDNFYCQTLTRKDEFRTMMNDIQRVYAKRPPMTEPLQVGSAVIAVFSEDGAMYRAEILELNKARGSIVRYVDFGNCAMVESRNIYRVEKKFMKMPKQAVQCSLKNVVPANGSSWSKSNRQEIDKCFDGDSYECSFHEVKNDKYIISLSNGGVDVAGQMVEKSLAAFAVSGPVAADNNAAVVATDKSQVEELPRFDISLLAGQVLRVKVSNVASVTKFHIQLPSATVSDKIIDAYMAEKDPNMLALPGELSVMQNQAVECCLKNSTSSLKVDEEFRDRIENKDVIIVIEEVDNNRLIVELYDTEGKRIKISPEEPDATICTLCPMPILHSTHKVVVSHAEHSGSVWLKRIAEMDTDAELLSQLYDYYSHSGEKALLLSDTLCAAKSSDGNWYRAKILHLSETGVMVKFLDYGNTEDVFLESVKALEPQFHIQPQLAIEVALTVTLGGSKDQQQEILTSHTIDKEFSATLYNVRKKWVAELTDEDGKISEKLSSLSVVEVSKNPEVQAEVQEMIVGGRYKVICTHADSPAQFWLQREEEIAAIEQQQEKIQIDAPGYPPLQGIPELNTLCVAMFSVNEQWYRAEVLDADEDIITIRFIDYGNTDVVDTNMGKIKQIPDSLKTTKRYAIKCRLDVIPYGADDWMLAACEYFNSIATSTENMEALVIADSNPRRVELFLDGASAVEALVNKNYATKIHTEEDLIDEIVEREIDPRAAYVSHAISPSEFWVQQEQYVGDLEVLADRFIVADMFPKVDEVKEGLLCVAKFPEDESWYRARVVSQGDSGTEVIYIDYGNSAVSTEIRVIPQDLAALPPFSKKCCLALPDGIEQWSEEAEVEFVKMAADGATVFLLDVLEDGEEISIVRLTSQQGEDIVKRLTELCERRVPVIEDRLPPLGEENSPNVLVSNINSPSEFWTQAESAISELEAMGNHLAAAESFLPLESIDEGIICAAKFPEDNQWYRARVLSHGDTGTEVLYIDYGNSAVTTELRRLPEDIVNIPALSMCCSLIMPEDIETWSKEACEKFFELVDEGITMFQYEILEESEQTLIRLTLDGKDIVETLSPLCAKKSQQADDPMQVIEDTREITASSEKSEIQHVKEIVEVMVDNVVSFERELDNVKQSISEHEKHIEERASSSNTSGVEVTMDSDTTTYSSSTKLETSKENAISFSVSESKSLTEITTNESIPSTVEYAESIPDKANGLELSGPKSIPSTVELVEDVASENRLEVSVPDNGAFEIESSTPEVSVAEENEEMKRPKTPVMNKIVPGNINKGDELAVKVSTEPKTSHDISKDTSASLNTTSLGPSKKLGVEDKIVLGRVSRGESSVEELSCPTTPKTPHSEKLVAGVVNLQEKLTDLEADESLTVVVEDKIVPGRVSRGESSVEELSCPTTPKTSNSEKLVVGVVNLQENLTDLEADESLTVVVEDKIVPGRVSRGESSVEELSCPTTPKTPHSEKLVAGVVNLQEKLTDLEADESLTVVVEENIPK